MRHTRGAGATAGRLHAPDGLPAVRRRRSRIAIAGSLAWLAGLSLLSAGCATLVPRAFYDGRDESGPDREDRTSTVAAENGEIRITPFRGASVQIEHGGRVVHVDPWGRGDYDTARPADLILVTDTPPDHLDPDAIARVRKPGAPVVLPDRSREARDEGGRERLSRVPGGEVMDNGERRILAGVAVEAVPMYDVIPGEPFHARGEGNGYVLTLGGVRIYLAGVTECTPEMRAVEDVDVLFVPMNLPNGRMDPVAAADCVREIAPRIVYPYHYRERPIDDFVAALADEPVEVRVLDWYPAP